NGAHTLTAKAFDAAGNNTTSAAVGVTVSNTSSELVVNGGFEGSSSPWVLSGTASSVLWSSSGGSPHGGSGVLHEGIIDNASGQTYQQISIPSGAAANLSFWLNVTSNETTTTTQYDKLFVEVRDSAGTLLTTLATYSNLNKGTLGVYSQKSFSLAAYRGQTIRLQFRYTTDVSLQTIFRIDDVSLQ
ncbi:MAG TPA: choice-of-anchor J domain-containing protein, partial [Myxococcales bacterium]|nr:choice-of-anchor J domain-containing protein [Myxococcales bacterium]